MDNVVVCLVSLIPGRTVRQTVACLNRTSLGHGCCLSTKALFYVVFVQLVELCFLSTFHVRLIAFWALLLAISLILSLCVSLCLCLSLAFWTPLLYLHGITMKAIFLSLCLTFSHPWLLFIYSSKPTTATHTNTSHTHTHTQTGIHIFWLMAPHWICKMIVARGFIDAYIDWIHKHKHTRWHLITR